MFQMEFDLYSVTTTVFATALLLLALVPLLSFRLSSYRQWRNGPNTLPPMAPTTCRDITKLTVEGTLHRYILKMASELGLVFRIPQELNFEHHFICCDPGLARLILDGDSAHSIPAGEKRDEVKLINKLTMNTPSILTKLTYGEGWDWARKGVSPAFSNTNLLKRLPAIQQKTAEFTDVLDKHIAENRLLTNFSAWMVKLTIDFISTSMFDRDFHTINHVESDIVTDGEVYLTQLPITTKEFIVMQITDLKRRLMFWRKEYKAAKEGAAQIAKVGQRILDRYRETHSAEEIELDSSIIGHLVRSPYPTEAARVADVTIFMLAGHDTTAYQVSWIVIELARHPEVVRKLRVELDSNLAPMGPRSCTAAQLSKLDYLDSVIKEGMRLWPVVAGGSQRKILADIPYKNFILPKGSSVGIANFAMFRNGIHDGHAFVPERWNDNDPDKAILKELFIPFSHGKRNCIGQALALLELKLVIATLFAAYDFEIIGEFKESAGLTLKPINADLKVTHRVK